MADYDFSAMQKEIKVFCSLAETNSFNQTAKNLKISQGTVSNRLKQLEQHLDTTLIIRDSRNFALTSNGTLLYDIFTAQQQQLTRIFNSFSQHLNADTKVLRVALPNGISYLAISPYLAEFSLEHPNIRLELSFEPSTYAFNMAKYSTDITLFAEEMQYTGNTKIEHLYDVPFHLYCSPQYIKRYGKVESLEQLKQHKCIGYMDKDSALIKQLIFHDSKGGKHLYENDTRIMAVNSPVQSKAIARSGHLIVFGYDAMMRDELRSGKIVKVLPDITIWKMPIYLAVRSSTPETKVFVKFIKECLQRFLS